MILNILVKCAGLASVASNVLLWVGMSRVATLTAFPFDRSGIRPMNVIDDCG